MPATPLVTFIVPCYNYARFLGDCLASIFAQREQADFELIVIDDASTDETQRVLERFTDPRLRVITHAVNQGHARTIDEGLAQARGRFIARIDPDDRYRPSFLADTLPIFEACPEVGLVYGDAALIVESGQIVADHSDRVHGGQDFKGNELVKLLERNFICAPTVIARRAAWLEAAPVPSHLAFNDWYFTLMMARDWEFFYLQRVLADYRVHGANHHSKIAADGSEERSIFWLLDHIFGEREPDAGLEARKQDAKTRVYATHYLDAANKYFGFRRYHEARRCYLQVLHYRPLLLLHGGHLHRLLGTLVGAKAYATAKSALRGAGAGVQK